MTVIGGSIIWFYTLTERNDFRDVWNAQPPATQEFLQNRVSSLSSLVHAYLLQADPLSLAAVQLSCCGYFNATAEGLFTVQTGFCAPGGAGVANAGVANPCITTIILFAE